mmetsp:Transcript_12216/g.20419  ORF Transcript_12216/g.20419 Transcript_12216/m.20419 type:complete len:126 (+) Transcript_12216:110-487(+)
MAVIDVAAAAAAAAGDDCGECTPNCSAGSQQQADVVVDVVVVVVVAGNMAGRNETEATQVARNLYGKIEIVANRTAAEERIDLDTKYEDEYETMADIEMEDGEIELVRKLTRRGVGRRTAANAAH